MLGFEYWSLSGFLKRKVKNALQYICRFETAAAREAHRRGFDGIICGHIQHAATKTIEGVLYINDGDWVESCTALAEDSHGNLELLCWTSTAPRPSRLRGTSSPPPFLPEAHLTMVAPVAPGF